MLHTYSVYHLFYVMKTGTKQTRSFTVDFMTVSSSEPFAVVRPSFPMMTITSSMMMTMSCLLDPVGAEVANQSNSGLQHSSTLGAWVCRPG